MSYRSTTLDCPTAQPDMRQARVFGLIGGTAAVPRVAYLKANAVVRASVLKNLGGIDPAKIYRFAAICEEHTCIHHDGARCALGERIVATLPKVVASPPDCEVRPGCRWHAEHGDAVCLRCPQVVTMVPRVRAAPPSIRIADGARAT